MRSPRRQFALNSASGWVAHLAFVATGFLMMPYVLSRLGAEQYGVYQLAGSSVVFFMLLQLGMGPTLVRYFAKAIARESREEIARTSSAAHALLGGLGLLAALLCLALIPLFVRFFNVPPEAERATTLLLVCKSASIFLNLTLIIPKGIAYGANHYDLANSIDIATSVLRLGVVVALFECFQPSIGFIGLAYLVGDGFAYCAYYALAINKVGTIVLFSFYHLSRSTMRSVFGFSMFNLANSVSQAIVYQAPILMIGKLLGQGMVTAFAPALLVSSAMTGFLGQTVRPLVPFASRDRENQGGQSLGRWAIRTGRLSAFLGFGMTLPFWVFGREILGAWLGADLAEHWDVVAVMSTGVAIAQVQAANYYLALGGGHIRPTVYSQVVMAAVVLFGTLVGLRYWGWGLFGVALFISGCTLLRNCGYLSFAYARQFGYDYRHYLWAVYGLPGLVFGASAALAWGAKYLVPPASLAALSIEVCAMGAIYCILFWLLAVPEEERRPIVKYLRNASLFRLRVDSHERSRPSRT